MSKDFEWKTGDDSQWDAPSGDLQRDGTADFLSWLKRWWRWLGLAAGLLLMVGFIIFTVLNNRVEEAEDTAVSDVLAAHSLIRQAALNQDFDLLDALIAPGNATWKKLQLDLLNVGLFLDRRPFSLKLIQESGVTPVVILSPDLQTAEVVEQFAYEITGGDHISETVVLEQTFFYQRREESWFLAPLPDDEAFWGRWQTLDEGNYLILIYRRREEALALYLAEEIDALIGRICEDRAMGCPPNFHLEMRLEKDPADLKMLNETFINLFPTGSGGIYHLSFPAPTLLGRPIDDAGRQALFHGYANWLAAVMVNRYANPPMSFGEPLHEQLAAWGLEPPPEPRPGVPFPHPISPPPLPFPEQDILLACSGYNNLTLLRFDPRANRWRDELSGRDTTYLSERSQPFFGGGVFMNPLPDDSGVLFSLTNFDGEDFRARIVSWRNGEERLWVERNFMLQLLQDPVQRQFDPTGRQMVLFNINFDQDSLDQGPRIAPYSLNVEDCLDGDCEAQFYDGFPYWSPDSSRLLLVDLEEQTYLTLMDSKTGEEIALDRGYFPFWLDTESFIYIRPLVEQEDEASPTVEIVASTVHDPLNGRVLVDSVEIASAAGEGPGVPAAIRAIAVHPNQPDWLFISVVFDPAADPREEYILSYRGDTGELSLVISLNAYSLNTPFQIIQDGQFLAVQTFAIDSPTGSLILIPLDPEEKTAGPPLETLAISGAFSTDWSRDGRWLLITGEESFRLVAPGYNYDQTITHDNTACTAAAWVNP